MSGSQRRCPTYSISVTFSIGDFFAEHRRSTHSKKTPAEAGAKLPSDRLAVLLLSALSGLLLLLAWLLLAAALLLARLVLAALLLAGILLVRIHNFSYFDSSPVMTTILTPLGCSRLELNS
jgi:hypothetical protein